MFGEDGVRLMCWAHVFRNIRPKLAAIRKANPALGASMLADVESIQWMVQSEAEFEDVCKKQAPLPATRVDSRGAEVGDGLRGVFPCSVGAWKPCI